MTGRKFNKFTLTQRIFWVPKANGTYKTVPAMSYNGTYPILGGHFVACAHKMAANSP